MRAMWRGSINFGLVNIPINLYTASTPREVQFKLLHKTDLSEIQYAKICKEENKEVDYKDIVKGIKVEDGKYVIFTDEDFEKINIEKSKSIDILDFVDNEEIDPVYYEKPYFIEPDKGAGKAYILLREALKKSNKVALCRFVLRNHEHIGALIVYQNALVLNQLRYQSEIVHYEDLKIPAKETVTAKEMEVALQLVNHMKGHFQPEKLHDNYNEKLKAMIEQKSKGKLKPVKGQPAPKPTKVHDIMALLKESLKKEQGNGKAKTAPKKRSLKKSA